jgi:sensor histidine kinase YesM
MASGNLHRMKWFFRYKLHHLLFWIPYYVFWVFNSQSTYDYSLPNAVFSTTIWLLGQGLAGYAGMYILVPKYFNNRRYVLFAVGSILVVLASAAFIHITMLVVLSVTKPGFMEQYPPFAFYRYVVMANVYTTAIFIAAKVVRDKLRHDRIQRQVEQEQLRNELRFLKSQINPHFLFNAINSIYVLIKKDADLAAHTLAKFSDMLRFQLYECNADEISIDKEILYLQNYISLEQLRKGKNLKVGFEVDAGVHSFGLAPLLLIPFVENAFKHVSACPHRENYVHTRLDYTGNVFSLMVENTVDKSAVVEEDMPGGIGQQNVKRRLALLYPDKHTLEITEKDGIYKVSLNLTIQ